MWNRLLGCFGDLCCLSCCQRVSLVPLGIEDFKLYLPLFGYQRWVLADFLVEHGSLLLEAEEPPRAGTDGCVQTLRPRCGYDDTGRLCGAWRCSAPLAG